MELEKKIEEEVFCLKFELDALAKHTLFNDHERWVHGFMNIYGEELHLSRYKFATKYIEHKLVLDIAGGCGYGTYYLASEGNPVKVDSVDLNSDSVCYGNYRYPHEKINRMVDNAETFVKEDFYDVVVSFETVEHLNNYRMFLENIYTSLKTNGTLIISTPVANVTSKNNENQYHVIEWSFDDFQRLIREKFIIEEVYVQNITEKKDLINTFLKRVINKISPNRFKKEFNSELVKYSNQFEPKNIISGFQILVCTRK